MSAQQAPALFGMNGASSLLKQCGGRATTYDIIRFMKNNYPQSAWMTEEMLRKALNKLHRSGMIDQDKDDYWTFKNRPTVGY